MTARLRSLAVLHPTFESWGGAEWYIHDLCEWLVSELALKVTLHTHRWSAPWSGDPSYEVRCHRRGGVRSGPPDWRAIARAIRRDVGSHDAVMIHNYPATQWYAEILSHASAPPALWFCHEPPRSLYGPQADEPLPARPVLRRALSAISNYRSRLAGHAWRRVRVRVERNLTGADRWRARLYSLDRAAVHAVEEVVANSHYTAARVTRLYGRAASVVYPVPRDLTDLEPGPQPRDRRVLWVGRLTRAKRPLDLIEAWSRAGRASPELGSWSLHLVGDGPLSNEVQRALGRSSGVTWDRALDRRELLDAYRSAALVIHLGIDEPLGLVPLEAMACGTPVLAHADGGVVETVEHGKTGWCIPGLNTAALADWLCSLPLKATDLPDMGSAAVERVRSEFDPGRWGGEIVTALEKLVGGRQCARRDT